MALRLLQRPRRNSLGLLFHIAILSDRPFKAPYVKRHEADAQIGHIFIVGVLTQPEPDCVFAVLPPVGDLHAVAGSVAADAPVQRKIKVTLNFTHLKP